MLALSFSRPWDYVILHCGKDIENRKWRTTYRGRICIHRAKSWDQAGFLWLTEHSRRLGISDDAMREIIRLQYAGPFCQSVLVGEVDITGCVSQSASPWFFGPYGFTLANAKPYDEVIPCRGSLKLWTVSVPLTGHDWGQVP